MAVRVAGRGGSAKLINRIEELSMPSGAPAPLGMAPGFHAGRRVKSVASGGTRMRMGVEWPMPVETNMVRWPKVGCSKW